ncbi:hypothetical protein [Bacteroides nordii]|jgi:hypothetical protein|uniref:hypothetical protein n=1 Tax=Bacteroides nordii TaxID=291645 RepID=UPI00189DC633|nr:hypothetical protein [Bacteroides nordii]
MIYTIRIATISDINDIVKFISDNWKKDHPLVLSKQLMDFQHFNKEDNIYNFIIGINRHTNEIDGLLGFIPLHRYDNNLKDYGIYWGAIWKVRDGIDNAEIKYLGYKIWLYLFTLEGVKTRIAVGAGPISQKFYRAAGYWVSTLNHYYFVNPYMENYKILSGGFKVDKKTAYQLTGDNVRFEDIDIIQTQLPLYSDMYPCKTIDYLIARYKNHPIYKYYFQGIYVNDNLLAIWVLRDCTWGESKAIRIVDMVGSMTNIPDLSEEICLFLKHQNAEYIDVLNWGIDKRNFERVGFQWLSYDNDIIVPNYFEPFVQENSKVYFATKDKSICIFKGDADQDRPNIIKNE